VLNQVYKNPVAVGWRFWFDFAHHK